MLVINRKIIIFVAIKDKLCLKTMISIMKSKNGLFMKTSFFILATIFLSMSAKAQNDVGEFGFFDHFGAGVSLGTDGIGIDLATPVTDWAALRAGVSFMPALKFTKSISIDDPDLYENVDIEAKLNIFDFKVLADFYPFKSSSFHITAGAFIGSEDAVTVTNSSPLIKDQSKYGKVGLILGNYRVTTDQSGNIDANVKVNSFKPYLGIGFGRAVPKKSRVSVSCDFGVKFWGKPGLGVKTTKPTGITSFNDDLSYHKFTYDELGPTDNKDFKDVIEIVEKIAVYPVLNVRVSGRIF